MADSTISQLPPTTSVNTTDVVPIDQGGVTKRATVAQIASAAAFAAGPPGPQGAIGISWLGTWNGVAPYPVRAAVFYKGSSYIAKYANTGQTPTDLNAWDYLCIGIPYGVNGLMKQDTSYNVSAAVPGVDYVVPGGVINSVGGGTPGAILYQAGTNTTAFTTAGTTGQFLQSNGTGAPSWATPAAATAIAGGSPGVVLWQIGTGTTAFTTAGTTGQVFISNGTAAPSWASQSTLSVGVAATAGTSTQAITAGTSTFAITAGTATSASWLVGGVAGAVPYQSGTGTTAFTTAGTSGQLFQSNGTAAPSWVTPTYATTGKAIALAMVFGG